MCSLETSEVSEVLISVSWKVEWSDLCGFTLKRKTALTNDTVRPKHNHKLYNNAAETDDKAVTNESLTEEQCWTRTSHEQTMATGADITKQQKGLEY